MTAKNWFEQSHQQRNNKEYREDNEFNDMEFVFFFLINNESDSKLQKKTTIPKIYKWGQFPFF